MEISWLVELAVDPDKFGDFWALTEEMEAASSEEPGTLTYERSMDDARNLHLRAIRRLGRGADSSACVRGALRPGLTSLIQRRRFTVYGEPSVELRQALGMVGATYVTPVAGFSRFTH
jgi:hypothetical protein